MPYRILRYQLAIIQKHMDKHPKDKLPLVMPIVFYNGKTVPYPYATNLMELFADKELFNSIGLGNFKLADLTIIEDDEILQDKKLALMEMLLKHIHDRDFNTIIALLIEAFKIAELQKINPSLIHSAIFYLFNGRERDELKPFEEQFKQTLPQYGETFMTYAEELMRDGEKKGIQQVCSRVREQGKLEGKRTALKETADKMLQAGISSEQVSKIIGIPLEELKNC